MNEFTLDNPIGFSGMLTIVLVGLIVYTLVETGKLYALGILAEYIIEGMQIKRGLGRS